MTPSTSRDKRRARARKALVSLLIAVMTENTQMCRLYRRPGAYTTTRHDKPKFTKYANSRHLDFVESLQDVCAMGFARDGTQVMRSGHRLDIRSRFSPVIASTTKTAPLPGFGPAFMIGVFRKAGSWDCFLVNKKRFRRTHAREVSPGNHRAIESVKTAGGFASQVIDHLSGSPYGGFRRNRGVRAAHVGPRPSRMK